MDYCYKTYLKLKAGSETNLLVLLFLKYRIIYDLSNPPFANYHYFCYNKKDYVNGDSMLRIGEMWRKTNEHKEESYASQPLHPWR